MSRRMLPADAPPPDSFVFYIIVSCLVLAGMRMIWNRFRSDPPGAPALILMTSTSFSLGLFVMAGLGGF